MLESILSNKYLNQTIDNFNLVDFTNLFASLFKNKKYKINTIEFNNNIIEIKIIDKNEIINFLKVKFILNKNNIIKSIRIEPNLNFVIIKNDNVINKLFIKR